MVLSVQNLLSKPLPSDFLPVARSANPPTVCPRVDIALGKLMTPLAMRLGSPLLRGCERYGYWLWESVKPVWESDLLEGEANFSPLNNGVSFQPRRLCKLHGKISRSTNNNVNIAPLVSLLLRPAGPFAILRAIWAIVVNSLDGKTFRTRTHVLKKVVEAVHPSVANVYPSSAVVGKLPVVRIVASALHSLPSCVERVRAFKRHDNLLCGEYSAMTSANQERSGEHA